MRKMRTGYVSSGEWLIVATWFRVWSCTLLFLFFFARDAPFRAREGRCCFPRLSIDSPLFAEWISNVPDASICAAGAGGKNIIFVAWRNFTPPSPLPPPPCHTAGMRDEANLVYTNYAICMPLKSWPASAIWFCYVCIFLASYIFYLYSSSSIQRAGYDIADI